MFLEVHAIPIAEYNNESFEKNEEHRRLIETTGLRIRHSSQFKNRAELVLSDGTILNVMGSLDELAARLERMDQLAKI